MIELGCVRLDHCMELSNGKAGKALYERNTHSPAGEWYDQQHQAIVKAANDLELALMAAANLTY